MSFAEHQFGRWSTAADGNSKGDHIDAAKRHPLYKAEAEAAAPALPVELEYLWTWYLRLSRRRQNGMGMNPLSSVEVLAWQARNRIDIDPFEHDVIDRLDDLYLSMHYKKDK